MLARRESIHLCAWNEASIALGKIAVEETMSSINAPYADVLWVRHCESCSNTAPTLLEKYEVAPICTERGVEEALLLSSHVEAIARNLGVRRKNVRFYCSYLPRAMMTAALTASAMQEKAGSSKQPHVQLLCHIGEFENSYESAEQNERRSTGEDGCVSDPSESISTKESTRCWLHAINVALERAHCSARLRMQALDCAPRKTPCRGTEKRAWEADQGGLDYAWVKNTQVAHWIDEARHRKPSERFLHVVVSHGSFIRASLFGSASQTHASGHMPNTAVAIQRYVSTALEAPTTADEIHLDNPSEEDTYTPAGKDSVRGEQILQDMYERILKAWGKDLCQWRHTSAPWARCLVGSRDHTLRILQNMRTAPRERLSEILHMSTQDGSNVS